MVIHYHMEETIIVRKQPIRALVSEYVKGERAVNSRRLDLNRAWAFVLTNLSQSPCVINHSHQPHSACELDRIGRRPFATGGSSGLMD